VTINDETTTWASRLDHYYQHGRSDILMKEIIINAVIILLFGSVALFFLRRSVNNDFAILQARAIRKA